ncbi:hypothetical protein FQZ97_1110440 [compost metagenome]
MGVGQGNGFGVGLDGFDRHLLAQLGQHAGRGVERQHAPFGPDQFMARHGDQAGAGGHVQQGHARLEAVAHQHLAPVPGAAAQRCERLGAVVAGRGLVEHGAGDAAALVLAAEIGVQTRIGFQRGGA